jgi:hypothetical protein
VSLPIRNAPWLLAPDDVYGFRMANRRIEDMSDRVVHFAKEHTTGESGAGAHDSIQITSAVCTYVLPDAWASRGYHPLRVKGISAGFRDTPRLLSSFVGAVPYWLLEFETILPLVGFTHHVSVSTASLPYSASIMAMLGAQREHVSSGNLNTGGTQGRIWIGDYDAMIKHQAGTLVANCASTVSGWE